MMPALLTRIVGAPSSAATRSTAAATWSPLLTSTPTAMARPPAAVIASTVAAAGRLVEVEDGHGVAVRGQAQGGGRTDAAGCSGDDGDTLSGHSWGPSRGHG